MAKQKEPVKEIRTEVQETGRKVKKEVDVKVHELEEYIREEPLKSVTAAFLLGLFIGKVMK